MPPAHHESIASKTALAIRHIDFEDLGFFDAPLREAGYAIRYHDAGGDGGWACDPVDVPLLVVLGGPIGVYEGAAYPSLDEEVAILRERIAAGRPTLGICLGAQLIARALGASVYPGPAKEIGFAPVALSEAGARSPLRAIAGLPVLHWHGDTFDLPQDATLLASTDLYRHQAFAAGPNTLALQFHPEAGGEIACWLTGHAGELRAAGIDPEPIRRDAARHAPALRTAAAAMLADWLACLPG